jgi:hypothetical protein
VFEDFYETVGVRVGCGDVAVEGGDWVEVFEGTWLWGGLLLHIL